MTPAVISGLILMAIGIFAWIISDRLAKSGTASLEYLQPGRNMQTFRRVNVVGIRVVGTVQFLVGLGLTVYAIMTGR